MSKKQKKMLKAKIKQTVLDIVGSATLGMVMTIFLYSFIAFR